jgi:CRISPR-associated protein Csx16
MTNEQTKVHRLVTFLGTGKYQPTIYALGERRAETTRFVCCALAELLEPAEIVVLATEQAENSHGPTLREALNDARFSPRFEPIPFGENPEQQRQQFEIIKTQLRGSAGPVMLDITHGFRSSPFFAAAIASFVRAVDEDPLDLRVCYAGALNAEGTGLTPIWDLSEFVNLLDWTQAIMLFLRTGRSARVAERTESFGRRLARESSGVGPGPSLRRLGATLREFGANLETVRVGDLLLGKTGSAAAMCDAIRTARESATAIPPLADVLDRLEREMLSPLLGAADHLADEAGHRALGGLARLYLEMGRWAEAAAVAREGWITRHATPAAAFGGRNQGRPSVDESARRDAEDRWNAEDGDAARRIAAVRNDIEHAGFKVQPRAADSLRRDLRRLVDEFAALPPAAARVTNAGQSPVFVNLSNHPSADWSQAQRQAALALQGAPEIRDLPFPEVPPEAGTADIEALADRVVDQLKREFPGATYAMVQGEFTLAHALVRRLQQKGIVCLAATTRRDVVEQTPGAKTTRFEFVRFREYG